MFTIDLLLFLHCSFCSQARKCGIDLRLLPLGMTRQAENTSRIHRQQHAASTLPPASGALNTPASTLTSQSRSSCVAWRVDWYFHAAEPPIHVVSPQLLGTAVVLDAVRQLWSPAPVCSGSIVIMHDSLAGYGFLFVFALVVCGCVYAQLCIVHLRSRLLSAHKLVRQKWPGSLLLFF